MNILNNNNKTRSNNNSTKSKNGLLILLTVFAGIIALAAVFFIGISISNSSQSASSSSQVSSDSSSKVSSSEKDSSSQDNNVPVSSQESKEPVDDGYNYVLVFADGTKRLSRTAPTGSAWQEGTSSPASNGHLGRTTYNQMSFKQMGGKTSPSDQKDSRDDYMKEWNDEYDADSNAMLEKSIPYYD
ncbi:hypothetical protein [Weissella minor]|uniref:hypothetical protein n=1 Tax=Weissella minor TaxID=1620 RepID=UPI00070F2415|nr:hypothetical protein [Weissella minor]